MMLAINMENLHNALTLMVQGMAGIFVTIIIIMAVIWLIPQVAGLSEKKNDDGE